MIEKIQGKEVDYFEVEETGNRIESVYVTLVYDF